MPASADEAPRPARAPAWVHHGALLAVFFLIEFLLFDQIWARYYSRIYPRWNDQIQYLTEAYTGYEYFRAHGFFAGLVHAFKNPAAQGTLHDVWTLAIFGIAGPSRVAALCLNLLWLMLWQAALYSAIVRQLGNRAAAWAALGLTWVALSPWNGGPGSAIDFRLDWMAAAALGLTLLAAARAQGFRARGAAAIFGLAVGLTLLTRFLTGAYFVLIYLGLLGWILLGPERGRRAVNLALSAVIAAALAGPVFWLNREWVWNYYLIGHFTGPESALRSPNLGLVRSVQWLADSFQRYHLGGWFWVVTGVALLALGVGRVIRRSPTTRRISTEWWVPTAIFFLAPALILIAHAQKSPFVLGCLMPAVLVGVAGAWHALNAPARLQTIVAALVVIASGALFLQRATTQPHAPDFIADARKINHLADYIFNHSQAAGLTHPRIAVDQVTDCLDGQVLRVLCYERKKVWMPFIMTLPTGIQAESEALLLERLAHSDFVFLTEDGPVGGWPYDRQMRELLPRTQTWCEEHLRAVERFTVWGRRMVLYQRRDIP